MKIKHLALVVAGMTFSTAVLATTPANYDTRFNLSARVPDAVSITDPEGNPVADLDVRLTPNGSGHADLRTTMSADTQNLQALRLWSNTVGATTTKVKLTLDDGNVSTGTAFALNSTSGGQLNKMSYKVSTIGAGAPKVNFTNSGEQKEYTLTTTGTHAEKDVAFVFESTAAHNTYAGGAYGGVVYATLALVP
ncbi:hypothetical protein [Budvicia diplopodorum]|uniref:hypothetical protein n=1 Tax=Budvicia diplopodorum TaxID=1119056 RepID=UPI00135886D1|nr:hypothetical protein [Budvicia diplopodorum]